MQEKEETEEVLENLETRRKIRKILVTGIIVVFVAIVLFLIFSFYTYFKSPETTLGLGASIDSALISEDGKYAYIKLKAGSFVNISKVKFIFNDLNQNEYNYETTEGISEIEVPYSRSFWDWLFGRHLVGNYNYEINSDEVGLDNFNDINKINVLFEYQIQTGSSIDSPVLDTGTTTNRTRTTSVSSGPSSTGTTTPTTTCTPKTCADYEGQCGSSLSNDCSGSLDCSSNCIAGTYCYRGEGVKDVCINNSINCVDSDELNYYNKGNITINNIINESIVSLFEEDFCSINLTEYSCYYNGSEFISKNESYECDYGCLDGKCELPSCTSDLNCTGLSGACGTGKCNLTTNICEINYNSSADICGTALGECDAVEYCSESSSECGNDLNKTDGSVCSLGGCLNGECVASCIPNCAGKVCGDDGCGGSCGSCDSGEYCEDGICVAGNIYYVSILDPACNDEGSGTSSQPWCNLNRSYNYQSPWIPSGFDPMVQEGDIVIVRNGNYSEFIESTATNPGEKWLYYRNNWITYKADEGHKPVIDKLYIRNEDKWTEWHTPNSHVSSSWLNPILSYDNSHSTFAEESSEGEWIEFQLNKTIYLTYARINASLGDSLQPNITIEAWDGSWIQVYTGNFSAKQSIDISISKNTDRIRIKSVDNEPERLRIYEIKLGEIDHGDNYLIFDGFRIPNGVIVNIANYVQIKNCNITNNDFMPYEGYYAPYFDGNHNVVRVTGSTYVTLENNDIWRNHRGLDMGGGGYNIVRNNSIHHVGEDVMNANSNNVIVENNILYDINKRRTPLWYFQGDMIGNFEVNETIVQENTGAEGLVVSVISSTRLNVIQTNNIDFEDGKNVTGLSSGALLYNVYVDYAHTDSIQIHSESKNLVVKGNKILRPEGGQGLKMVGPDNVSIVNNFIYTTVPLYWSGTEGGITLINNTLVLPPGFPSSSGAPAVGYEGREPNIMYNMSNNIIYRWAIATDLDLGNYTVYTRIINHKSNIFGNNPDNTGGLSYPFYIDSNSEIVNYNITSLFVDPANMDYRVLMSTPACDGSVNGKPEVAVGAYECVCRNDTDCIFGGSCINEKCVGTKNCFETNISCGIFPSCTNCNQQDGCYGNEYRDYYCINNPAGCGYDADDCTDDCSCACDRHGEIESIEMENCLDGIDNDCDGNADIDFGCQVPAGISTDYLSYYRFEGSVKDFAGNYNGKLKEYTTPYNERLIDNYAIGFDGTLNYIQIGNSGSYIAYENQSLTVSMWINPKQMTGRVFNIYKSGSSSGFIISTNQVFFNSSWYTFNNQILTNTWQHVAAVYNGSCMQKYFNGAPDGTCIQGRLDAGSPTVQASIAGKSIGTPGDFINGSVDEVMIYNRTLTDAEIQQIYNSQGEVFSLSPFTQILNWLKGLLTTKTANAILTGNAVNETNETGKENFKIQYIVLSLLVLIILIIGVIIVKIKRDKKKSGKKKFRKK